MNAEQQTVKAKVQEKNLDYYINLARQRTEEWPEWKKNMFSSSPHQQKVG